MTLDLIQNIMYALLGIVLGVVLVIASDQDFKTRALTVPMAWAFICLTGAFFLVHGYIVSLVAYIIFMIWSFFLYENRLLQLGGAVAFIVFGLLSTTSLIPFGTMNDAFSILLMGALWLFAFMTPRRGESDYNVLFTSIAFFGPDGYLYFVVVLTIIYILMLVAKIASKFSNKRKNFLHIVYMVYFMMTNPKAKEEPLAMGIKKLYPDAPVDEVGETPIPMIPVLHLAIVTTMFVLAVVLHNVWLLAAGVGSLLALGAGVIKLRVSNK